MLIIDIDLNRPLFQLLSPKCWCKIQLIVSLVV